MDQKLTKTKLLLLKELILIMRETIKTAYDDFILKIIILFPENKIMETFELIKNLITKFYLLSPCLYAFFNYFFVINLEQRFTFMG